MKSADGFITDLKNALSEQRRSGASPATVRRKLRTVAAECGQRATSRFREELRAALASSGIYSEPQLGDMGLRLDDWVLFAEGPFPPDAAFFPRERDLQRFVESCLGSGAFRGLELWRAGGRSGREFRLPNGTRIDLLCQERARRGPGALVAIEFKRDHERGTVQQMVEYIDGLQEVFPGREVRGIVVSGREDQVSAALLKSLPGYQIDWMCYEVSFRHIASSAPKEQRGDY